MLNHALRLFVLTALCLVTLSGLTVAQTTVYNNFGPDHDGWDYNYGLGWTVAGEDVIQQYGVEQAMAFDCTVDGTLSDIWVAFWYVPMSADPDTVTLKLTLNPNGLPPVEDDVLETWVMTDFESWTQWNDPIHLEGNGTTQLVAGQSYWLWAVAEELTWTGWCMNIDPSFTCPHAMRREGEDWLNVSNETASAFRVDVIEQTTPSMIVNLVPIPPIILPANGGMLRYTALVENIGATTVTFDAWTETVGPNGNTYGPLDLFTGLVFPAGHAFSGILQQMVPGWAPAGQYTFRACVGEYPHTIYDSSEFLFGKRQSVDGPYVNDWSSSGWNWANASNLTDPTQLTVPTTYTIDAVYPNPFNPVTTVSVTLPDAAELNVTVLNTLGQQVATLAQGQYASGQHTFTFDGSSLSSGVYFVRLDVPGVATDMKKMMLMK